MNLNTFECRCLVLDCQHWLELEIWICSCTVKINSAKLNLVVWCGIFFNPLLGAQLQTKQRLNCSLSWALISLCESFWKVKKISWCMFVMLGLFLHCMFVRLQSWYICRGLAPPDLILAVFEQVTFPCLPLLHCLTLSNCDLKSKTMEVYMKGTLQSSCA